MNMSVENAVTAMPARVDLLSPKKLCQAPSLRLVPNGYSRLAAFEIAPKPGIGRGQRGGFDKLLASKRETGYESDTVQCSLPGTIGIAPPNTLSACYRRAKGESPQVSLIALRCAYTLPDTILT